MRHAPAYTHPARNAGWSLASRKGVETGGAGRTAAGGARSSRCPNIAAAARGRAAAAVWNIPIPVNVQGPTQVLPSPTMSPLHVWPHWTLLNQSCEVASQVSLPVKVTTRSLRKLRSLSRTMEPIVTTMLP